MAFVVWAMAVAMVTATCWCAEGSDVCHFNPLCTCRRSHHEVICRGVPFYEVPPLTTGAIYQVTLIRSGLESLHNNQFEGSSLSSLHLMQNHIQHLAPWTFGGLEGLLTTLDLSHNRLTHFPSAALSPLAALRWLNLHGNQIDDLSAVRRTNHLASLESLFLGANHVIGVPEGAFAKLANLLLLDLEGNLIHDVGTHSFPASLRSLSLSNNLLRKVPLHALYTLKHLRHLSLSGNLLHRLPCPFHLSAPRLDKLALANNLLDHLPPCALPPVKEVELDFNFLRTLPPAAFRGTHHLEKLALSNNRIASVHADAFDGVETTLATLDMSFNLLEGVPAALARLQALAFLSLKGNLLERMGEVDLQGSRGTLEVLDLSGNLFRQVPRKALKSLAKLARLSLQDNRIQRVYRDDFEGWGHTLATLSLANNRMTYLSGGAFTHLSRLRELKLSFNDLMYLDQQVFVPLKKSLEVLDLSSALSPRYNHPLETFIRDLGRLEWLQIDHNNATGGLSADCFRSLPKLHRVDASHNDLEAIPEDLFTRHAAYLSTVHMSNNPRLGVVRTSTFDGVPRLATVVLYGNGISKVEFGAFANCPYLHTVVLSENGLSSIEPAAFVNLTRLTNLYLQDNELDYFSFDVISGDTSLLYANLSSNALTELDGNATSSTLKLRTLDLSNNQLSVIPDPFLEPASHHLVHLFLSENRISALPATPLPVLQVLHLSGNDLPDLDGVSLACCWTVQVLMLDHNRISNVSSDSFSHMRALRILDLSHNGIDRLPEGVFLGTAIERLNLSRNAFDHVPGGLGASSIRHLDLSGNLIPEVTSEAFAGLARLQGLNLSSNRISFLHDQSFHALRHLSELDLSHNPLRQILHQGAFRALSALRSLHLRNASLVSVVSLPLPHLRLLDLRHNLLHNVSALCCGGGVLRHLWLSGNLLPDVPGHLWHGGGGRLASLDVSDNPIEVLGVDSFAGLERLQHLDISGLMLKRLDPRTLHGLRFLTSLKTDSYASVRSFRLQDLLSQSPALRKVTVNVEESTLSHQVQRAFGTKLRELSITGPGLREIVPDAFSGLQTHELTLRISGTRVARLPDGLLRYLPDVRFLTLDLRDNRLRTLAPPVLAAPDSPTDVLQTIHISGGVLLEDNPWTCSCELLWLGRWLRRWLRETFHVHVLSVEAALYVNAVARKARCVMPVGHGNVTRPLVDLRWGDVDCGGRGAAGGTAPLPLGACCSWGWLAVGWGLWTVFVG